MIDFHLHVGHFGRTVDQTLAHMDAHGVAQAVILPIDGTSIERENWPTEVALNAARAHPDRLIPFCHVDPLKPDAPDQVRRYRDAGALGFGEHKVRLPCDAPESLALYAVCGELSLPVLLHFQYGTYNANFDAFERVVREHPDTIFIGHAQAWWANVSTDAPTDPSAPGFVASPKGPVRWGGLTDRWLGQYPNLYADLSAGSGLNALTRDPAFTRDFVERHRRKLLWATDCGCLDGKGTWGPPRGHAGCIADANLPALRAAVQDDSAFQEITDSNARRLLDLAQ